MGRLSGADLVGLRTCSMVKVDFLWIACVSFSDHFQHAIYTVSNVDRGTGCSDKHVSFEIQSVVKRRRDHMCYSL